MGLVGQSLDQQLTEDPTTDPDEVVSSLSWIEAHPVATVRIDSLVLADTPRLNGTDEEHVRLLAESGDALPPIMVHRQTMRVLDGAHRIRAALANGRGTIEARLLSCDETAAFVLAVNANVTHGLPLTQADRSAAAARIIQANPQWSDRAVAVATALSDKTVARIRARSNADLPKSNSRVGRDGRVRPTDSAEQRRRAAELIRQRPEAGLREISREIGLSPATVRDVRERLGRGEDPVPDKYRSDAPNHVGVAGSRRAAREDAAPPTIDRELLLAQLSEDPSLRLNEGGRKTLRWLRHYTVDTQGLEHLVQGLPDHCAPVVADLARSCAASWTLFAEQLQQRVQ